MFNLFQRDNTDNFEFLLTQIGSDVTINEAATPTRAIVTNSKAEAYHDDRKISTLSPLQRGDIVVFNGVKYMVISEINDKRYNKRKGVIRRLTHRIIINSSCRFCAIDCYITTQNFGISGGQVLSAAEGDIQVYLSQHNVQSEPKLDDRFIVDGQAFKIAGIDSFSMPGVVVLSCEKDSINPATDDLENNIAGGKGCSVEVTNTEPVTVTLGNTLQLTWTSTSNAPVTFESSNQAIATVDASGLVSGLTEGEATITIRNSTNEQITDSMTITVEDMPAGKTILITSSKPTQQESDYLYLYYNSECVFTATVYDGEIATEDSVTLELFADDQTSAVDTSKFNSTNISGNDITISAKSTNYYFQLKASLTSDSSVFTWRRIRVKPLF